MTVNTEVIAIDSTKPLSLKHYFLSALTLGLGSFVAVLVSLVCSFWFFYSLSGSHGITSIFAGIAGCSIQLCGYGFASTRNINPPLRVCLCVAPIALSIFCTYATVYGFLVTGHEDHASSIQKSELTLKLIDQSMRDQSIASLAAEQGLEGSYREQAKKFLQHNNNARNRDERLLESLSGEGREAPSGSPLSGLISITGDGAMTIILFCAWVSLMFDLLPVVALYLISGQHRPSKISHQQQPCPSKPEHITFDQPHHAKENDSSGGASESGPKRNTGFGTWGN